MTFRMITFACLFAFTVNSGRAGESSSTDGPSAAVMQAVTRSVIQVISRDCPEGSRTGTGFIWGNAQQAVTALHVVAGCKNVSAYFQGKGEVAATPSHQLPSADLVLLHLDQRAAAPPLQMTDSEPVVNDILEAIGYYYGVQTLDSRRLEVTIGSTHNTVLRDMLPDALKKAVHDAGSPELSVRILRMEGHLLPGLSGAPVINASGQVVGIGSGGLADGAAGVSWAIRSSYLKDLLSGPAVAPINSVAAAITRPGIFFSFEEGFTATGSTRKCGDLDFVHFRSSTVGDLGRFTDDPVGFLQLASTSGISADKLAAVPLDTYVNPASGASVAVPAGAAFVDDHGMCKISLANGKYTLWIVSARATSPIQVNQITQRWEQTWSQKVPLTWMLNPAYSYGHPTFRSSDGLTVNRKTFAGYNVLALRGEAFETLMARGNTVVGVMIMSSDFDPPLYQKCLAMASLPECAQVNTDYSQWVAAISGTALSTFPPQ